MIGLLGSMLGGRGGRMIGGMIGGRHGAMLGGLAGAMLGGRQIRRLGGLLKGRGDNDDAQQQRQPEMPHSDGPQMSEGDAEILVRAMCNAAKADGHVDEKESNRIIEELGDDATADEQIFLRRELRAPHLPARDFATAVPKDLAGDTYAVSLISITVDTMEEAAYLRDLRDGLGLSHGDVDAIHDQLDAPRL